MAILKRPMFRKGGSANSGIMGGLERRGYADSNWEDLAASQMRGYQWRNSNWGQQETKPITFEDFQESFKGGNYASRNIGDVLIEQEVGSEGDVVGVPLRDFKIPKVKTALQIALEKEAGSEQMAKDIALEEILKTKKIPVVKKPPPDGTINGARGYDENSFESRKHNLSERAKYFAEVLNPNARERMITKGLDAASEAFGKSTGNTFQDVARALGAAGSAMSGAQNIKYDAAKLALMEDIELKGIRETAKAKALYRDYAPSEKIKSFNELKKHMSEPEAIDRVFGSNNIYANVAEASSKEVGVPESSINIAAGQTYKEDYKGQVDPDEWDEFKDQLEDGVYKVGKKIYEIKTVDGKKQPPKLLADFASTKI